MLFGVACGLGVALFLLGYFSGSSKKVPVVLMMGDQTLLENPKNKYERKLSVVHVPASLKLKMTDLHGLEQLTRYRNEKKTAWSVDTGIWGSIWSEDIVIGFAESSERDTQIFRCAGRTNSGVEYGFYSTFRNCWGAEKPGKDAGFRLPRNNPSPLHIPVFSCLTPDQARYLSLNSNCESEKDVSQEVLGHVRAASILVSDEATGDKAVEKKP
ncbi:MAG: hypothetical protein JST16_14900 [Bdellovibrionales bacterium]|nr:hypothetical protein [Bdellovibrionales bacterium]